MAKLSKLIDEKWLKDEETPEINREEFLESVSKFNDFGKNIYRKGDLKEIANTISNLVESAEQVALQETEEWFDRMTVARDMKRIKESAKHFVKTMGEMNTLQQRLESLYEDIGSGLNRYFDIKEVTEGNYYVKTTGGDRVEVQASSEKEAKEQFLKWQRKGELPKRLKIDKVVKITRK